VIGSGTAICSDDAPRRSALRQGPLNGLDYLEVSEEDRHILILHLIARAGALSEKMEPGNFVIEGGRRVRNIRVVDFRFSAGGDALDDSFILTTDRIGDFSIYRLSVVETQDGYSTGQPHPGFDPVYAALQFSFLAGCPSSLDCAAPVVCPEPPRTRPTIDYMAKDYASFRQLLLDRLSQTLPNWTERHEPDALLTLVELLAYEGDRLSYYQDAVASEAYLFTARQRISVRRHARLVDYHLHEGCNARAWLFVEASEDSPSFQPDDFFFTTAFPGAPQDGVPLSADWLSKVPEQSYEVFEPLVETAPHWLSHRHGFDLTALARRLLRGDGRVETFLRERLSPAVRDALRSWGDDGGLPMGFGSALLNDLNRLSVEQSLHDEPALAAQRETPQAQNALQKALRGTDIVRLNQLLLEAAFENELPASGTIRFYKDHNRIILYDWGERGCCLPRGTTSATLLDVSIDLAGPGREGETGQVRQADLDVEIGRSEAIARRSEPPRRILKLFPGEFLLLEEVISPTTGLTADADPEHRHVVRLTSVEEGFDPVFQVPVLEVGWAKEDALPFALCLSAMGPPPECKWLTGVSVARGNVLLVDNGRRGQQSLDAVEVDAIDEDCDECRRQQRLVARPYRPVLDRPNLTFAQPLVTGAPAKQLLRQNPSSALPRLRLRQVPTAPPRLDVPDPLERYRNPQPQTAFDPEDVLSPAALASRLRKALEEGSAAAQDPMAAYLLGKLDEMGLHALRNWATGSKVPPVLADSLLAALNSALDDPRLYDEQRFPDAVLDESTLALRTARPLGPELERLFNRWLLEQTFAEGLAPARRFVETWTPVYDLLSSSGEDRHVAVEMANDRRAHLRFGNGELGRQPEASSRFDVFYRTGNGAAGNVGAETISIFVTRSGTSSGITLRPRNPFPATGGTDPETLDKIRQRAPYAIRRELVRAITAEDYGALALRDFAVELQGAAGALVWTGSWYEARVGLDPFGREDVPRRLIEAVRADLSRYRRMGHDLRVVAASYVPLAISLHVCVKPDYQQGHVRSALMNAFSSGLRDDGAPGFFHPDNLTFGQSLGASAIVATAQQVAGVLWSRVTRMQRLDAGNVNEIESGILTIGATEIARIDNVGGDGTPGGWPEDGVLMLELEGGR
jgi:predicted phage baseplate assembly protein